MLAIEVEYEGGEEFLKEELTELLTRVTTLYGRAPRDDDDDEDGYEPTSTNGTNAGNGAASGNGVSGAIPTTGTIAQRLKVTSGPELIMAAMLRLTLTGVERVPRKQLLTEMRTATAFWKENYSGNLGKALKVLAINGRLNDAGPNTYVMPPAEKAKLSTAALATQ